LILFYVKLDLMRFYKKLKNSRSLNEDEW
jgi:hypothetical protein